MPAAIAQGQEPPYIERALDLPALLAKKSHFLLGPRQTGKSFLVRRTLPGVRVYNLLENATYLALSHNPGRIAQELSARDRIIVIDEILRLPELLNEVHLLIEERGARFLLTDGVKRTQAATWRREPPRWAGAHEVSPPTDF